MNPNLRTRIGSLALLAFSFALAGSASAQTYPDKVVKLVVPFAAGGSGDIIGRIYAEKLSALWKRPVVVENKAGAGGNIASDFVAKAPADGYTLLLAANSHVFNGSLYANRPYDPIKDFTAVAGVAYYSLILVVNPELPIRSLKEMVAYAKANPGKMTFGSAGVGTSTHLANELFKNAAGIDIVHSPYKSAGLATTDLLGGHIQAIFNNPISALPFVKSGKLRPLVTTGPRRLADTPDVPTIAESGYPGFEAGTWWAILAPAGLPKNVVTKVSTDLAAINKMPDVIARLKTEGVETWSHPPGELSDIMLADQKKWGKIIKDANIKLD